MLAPRFPRHSPAGQYGDLAYWDPDWPYDVCSFRVGRARIKCTQLTQAMPLATPERIADRERESQRPGLITAFGHSKAIAAAGQVVCGVDEFNVTCWDIYDAAPAAVPADVRTGMRLFTLPSLDSGLNWLAGYLYGDRADFVDTAATLVAALPGADDEPAACADFIDRLFLFNAVRPIVDFSSTEFFRTYAEPRFRAALAGYNEAVGVKNLGDFPRTDARRRLTYRLLATGLNGFDAYIAHVTVRQRLDRVRVAVGRALADPAASNVAAATLASERETLVDLAAAAPSGALGVAVLGLADFLQ